MEYLQKIKENLCGELEELAMKPEMSAGDLETIHKLTDTIKNIDKIAMLEDGDGYSQAGDWEMEGRGSYERGSSYRGRKRDSMGRYSRDGSRNAPSCARPWTSWKRSKEARYGAGPQRDRH